MKAQLLVEIDIDVANAKAELRVTRFYDATWTVQASKPLYTGTDLAGVRTAILSTFEELKAEFLESLKPQQPQAAAGFGDNLGEHLADGVGMELACGHPNILPGNVCPLCGKMVP